MCDNAWLAAYEAQKAAVMEKIQQKPESVSGTSKFSGLVDTDQVQHAVKSNQVTKLMTNLKKQSGRPEASKKQNSKVSGLTISPSLTALPKDNSVLPHGYDSNHCKDQELDREVDSASALERPINPPKFVSKARSEGSNLKRKTRSDGIGVKDLLKKVKSDAARKQSDWAEVNIISPCCVFLCCRLQWQRL